MHTGKVRLVKNMKLAQGNISRKSKSKARSGSKRKTVKIGENIHGVMSPRRRGRGPAYMDL
jgi:hypothetical protein